MKVLLGVKGLRLFINSKQTWKVVNELLGNQFNNYFVNAGIELSERFLPSDDYKLYLTDAITERFTFTQVSCLDVENIVRSFKDSSPGADEIPMKSFEENLPVLG